MYRLFLLSFALLFALNHSVFAQVFPRFTQNTDTAKNYLIKSRFLIQAEHENGGELKPNDRAKETLKDSYYNAFNIRIGLQTQYSDNDSIDNIYNQIYNYPIYGIGLFSSTFRSETLGKPYAVYGFVSIPIAPKVDKRWNLNYRISLGIAGKFNPYDKDKNPGNQIIGSKRNVFIDFGFQTAYAINSRFQVGMGLSFHHFSNGALNLPNTGVNLVPLTAFITYIPEGKSFNFKKENIPPAGNADRLHIIYAAGAKQINLHDDTRYFKSTLGAYYSHNLGYKWRMGGGLDVFYSASGHYTKVAGDKADKFGSLFSTGVSYYVDHLLTRQLYLSGSAGYYLHRNEFNGEIKPFYLRIGARMRFYKYYFGGVSIKAHGGKADFIEWTVGKTIRLNGLKHKLRF